MDVLITGDGGASELAARICHEANAVLQQAGGEPVSPAWHELDEETRMSAISGVHFAWDNPFLSPANQHEEWCRFKAQHGWTHGETKDAEAKTHPCLVPYNELPVIQQAKDGVFRAVALGFYGRVVPAGRSVTDLPRIEDADVGRIAYEAYSEAADWKTFDGRPIPPWTELPDAPPDGYGTREKWVVAVQAVRHFLQPRQAVVNTRYEPADVVLPTLGMDATAETRSLRQQLDRVLQQVKSPASGRQSRERSLAVTKIQEAVMWLGMDLKAQREEGLAEGTSAHDEPGPYPASYSPESDAPIAPTADGLTL